MAEQQVPQAPPQAPNAQLVVDREQLKIPHYYADKDHDTVKIEYWVDRIDRLQATHGWSSLQTANNAINSLRGKALHMIVHLQEIRPASLENWPLFKKELLDSYGSSARDTSSIANLTITQRKGEPVVDFTHRVTIGLREFYQAVPEDLNIIPVERTSQRALQLNPDMQTYLQPPHIAYMQWYANFIASTTNSRTKDYMGMTIFINGLLPELKLLVKNAQCTSYQSAITKAKAVEKNLAGPVNHTIALEQPNPSKTTVNFIKRGGFRGRSSHRGGRSSTFSTRATNGSSNGGTRPGTINPSTDCWYCHNKGHVQINCRKRINRGAALVKRPRSVQEIEMDIYAFQEADDFDDDDTDDYLDQSLAAVEEDHHDINDEEEDGFVASIHLDGEFSHHLN